MKELIMEQSSTIIMDLNFDDLDTDWEKVHQASKSRFEKLRIFLLCYAPSYISAFYLKKSLSDGLFSEEEVIQRYRLDQVIKNNEKFKGKSQILKEYYLFVLKIIKILKYKTQRED
ncbi:dynamin like TRAFAC class GTpase domain [Cryptosporidium sp. chipmunk genotype I]|uniref:dynamin like TRAFAC class GTpase domain n=1 Tax=Cryptosporidium sp. chipmunk genotype I TaxID=1280935 RepID=UPI00351A9AFD|nr:dynamin like TRAFAC class GTpase domain [Cryptosporidium sp. chipmunk genotype I]